MSKALYRTLQISVKICGSKHKFPTHFVQNIFEIFHQVPINVNGKFQKKKF